MPRPTALAPYGLLKWARVFRNQGDAHGRSDPSAMVLKKQVPGPLLTKPEAQFMS